jgi:signal transduction histidine kinase
MVLTGFMLTKSAADTAIRQTHRSITRELTRDKDRTMDEIITRNHRAREIEKEILAGTFVPRDAQAPRDGGASGPPPEPDRGKREPGAKPPSVVAKAGDPASGATRRPTPPDPRDPANRPRSYSALYTMDGKPYPDFQPQEMTYKNQTIAWPKSLSSIQLPDTFLPSFETDPNGRFKVLCISDVSDQFAQLHRDRWALLVLWPIFVALLGIASYLAVGSSFQPLHKLLKQAETLGLDDRMQTADQAEFGELAASINSYLDRIEKVVKQQEEFAVDAAHELCTPLTALRGQLELALMHKGDTTGYGAAAKSAINQVSRLERLVESLLLATRPRDGVVAPCDAQQALEEVQARWVDRYADKGVELQLSAEAFKAAMPEEEIESVMENLLANALKFSPSGTMVRITLDAQGHLIVQDQGPGIPVDDRERVFDRFERGTTKARGFGIGLYLVRRLLEQRGGQITIGDSPVGARVEVALP